MAEEKKGFKFPSAYTILFILIILVVDGHRQRHLRHPG
jgi:uncharacterized ion transporter superfamily protein YfcC